MLKIIGLLSLLTAVAVSLPAYTSRPNCDGVVCIPNPGNCEASYEKDSCCPVWYCRGQQGGVFTSFGKSKVNDNGYGSTFSESAVSSNTFKGRLGDNGRDEPQDEATAVLNGFFSDIDPPNSVY